MTFRLRKRHLDDKTSPGEKYPGFPERSLEKTDQITGNMLDILSKFEVRIHKLEDTIVPVHRETDDLQRRQASILYNKLLVVLSLSHGPGKGSQRSAGVGASRGGGMLWRGMRS
ncbi:Exocyst complex component 7 [Desmophyllum pertusum]|uniref:Exocyst complex component 7 n=1 Tax=Desmophyllum pertusum TaxID=174260 RepID=A0A9W9Y6S1_9CNID|nr:Exocyst complex component 7 [Desmophyllum pertusum]